MMNLSKGKLMKSSPSARIIMDARVKPAHDA